MINIQIDVSSLVDQVYLDKKQVDNMIDFAIKDVTNAFADQWRREAANNLKSARQEYVANVNAVDEGFAKGAVVLTGWLPNAIEEGMDGFDMKEGFLNGPNAKTGKDGSRYNTIPFKHGTPGALPENFSGGIMPAEIHAVIKKEPVGPSGKSRQLVKDDLPKKFQAPKVKSLKDKGMDTNRTYTHKNAIYEGLRKSVDAAGNKSYESFRRVSDNSDPNSWEHPGLKQRHFAESALSNFDTGLFLGRAFDLWWSENM